MFNFTVNCITCTLLCICGEFLKSTDLNLCLTGVVQKVCAVVWLGSSQEQGGCGSHAQVSHGSLNVWILFPAQGEFLIRRKIERL